MSTISIYYSINHILKNNHVNRIIALFKYVKWQLIKAFNLFPLKIKISNSIIEIQDKLIALEGGTKMYTQGMYDYNNMNLIKHILKIKPGIFFDIGTNIGVYSLIASESNESKIISFEPHPYTFQILNNQIKLNQRINITTINKAVSNKNGKVMFTNQGGSSVNKVASNEEANTIEVDCITMNSFCNYNNLLPEIVKLDVEGYELEVLEGFENSLNQVNVLLIEISKNKEVIHQMLTDKNFIGPLSFDYKNLKFKKFNTTDSIEDPIYVLNEYKSKLISTYSITFSES